MSELPLTQTQADRAQLLAQFAETEYYRPVLELIEETAMEFFAMPGGGLNGICNWVVSSAAQFFMRYLLTRLSQVVETGRTLSQAPETQGEQNDDESGDSRRRA